jgi:hypothetical protein
MKLTYRPSFSVATQLMLRARQLYDMDPWDIPRLGQSRADFKPRFAVTWVLREMAKDFPSNRNPYSGPRVARLLGFADNTMVTYASRRAGQMRETDPDFRKVTDELLALGKAIGPIRVAEAA